MEFSGQVWFKFGCEDAWLFYRFVRKLAEGGTKVALEWLPIPTPSTELPCAVYTSLSDANDRGRFFHAMFGLTFLEHLDAGAEATVDRAVGESGVRTANRDVNRSVLDGLTEQADALGVTWSPSLYRHGPVTAITLTPAVLQDDPVSTAKAILAVADNDGIWGLSKP